jgi:hypothetical protein
MNPDSDKPVAAKSCSEPAIRTPLWVKVFGAIAILLVLLVISLHLTGGGFGHHHTASFSQPQQVERP